MGAEGVGFEPTRREDPPTRFPVARTRPDYATLPDGCDSVQLNRGGEGGIRTHGGGLPHTAFREQHLKPLGHLSTADYTGGLLARKQKTYRYLDGRSLMVRPGGFEPPASWSATKRSIH